VDSVIQHGYFPYYERIELDSLCRSISYVQLWCNGDLGTTLRFFLNTIAFMHAAEDLRYFAVFQSIHSLAGDRWDGSPNSLCSCWSVEVSRLHPCMWLQRQGCHVCAYSFAEQDLSRIRNISHSSNRKWRRPKLSHRRISSECLWTLRTLTSSSYTTTPVEADVVS